MKQFYILLIALLTVSTGYSQNNFFEGNGNSGFGGLLGEGGLDIDFQEFNTFFILTPGGPFNDAVVIYIDSDESGNYVDTFGFTDTADPLRIAISGFNGNEIERAGLNFPPGFEADYAIALDSGLAGLWKLNNGAEHDFLQDLDLLFDGNDYYFDLLNANIGDPNSFKFFATYLSLDGFRSNEAIGTINIFFPDGSGNAGYGNAAFDTYWTTSAEVGGFGSTTSLATNWSFDGSWSNGNLPFDTDYITINHDLNIDVDATVGVFDINASNTVTIDPGKSLSVSGNATDTGDFINDGDLVLNSTSTTFSSLIVDGNVSGSGTTTYNRFTAQVGPTGTNDLISSPIDGQEFGPFATANTGSLAESGTLRAFAPFDPTADVYTNYDTAINASTEIALGVGYRAGSQASGGETLAFSGTTPNNGPISVPLIDNTSFWNLMGNPYPSYMRLGDFLTENVATTNINSSFYGVYGYDADTGDGSLWTILDLNSDQDLLIAPGQGFFVAAPSGGGNGIDFTPSMQRIGTSNDFISRNGENTNSNFAQAIINLSTSSTAYETNIYFRDTNTRGLDPGFDTGAFSQTDNGIYTQLVEDNAGVNLANQSLPYSDLTDILVPTVVNLDPSTQITFSLNNGSDLPTGINVYLEDSVENTSTLLNSGDYTITPSTVLSGSGRFFLRFTDNALSTSENTEDNYKVFADFSGEAVIISGEFNNETTVRLYDLQGREVLQDTLKTNTITQSLNTTQLRSGVYIVKVENENLSFAKKVMIR